ncbi:MAG: polysaccharide biosynthesis protein [Butyrivibrio sp.]|uniref:putative polysaccharide biosynthesis protein n=1 Tax=Butyrivibrio sp. TaxID=28121 RepID=UPI0025FCE1F4|nr:polysaccharide biosynthesis protein [Butyrivibrio sp.]MCR5773159.1 polysaccharide biosynthesis protein [Butyrivibrio sp.]
MEEKNGSGILKQAGILAAAGIIVRIIGLLYKSPLTSIIGDEGNGYYNAAYNWYITALMIASYSIPSAISKVMSQKFALGQYKSAQKLFRCALVFVGISGTVCGILLMAMSEFLVGEGGAYVLRVFGPTVVLYGPLGVLRGYFQAHRTMVPTSVSQIAEQLVNAFVSILAAFLLTNIAVSKMNANPDAGINPAIYGAAGSALGTGAGVLTALIFMILVYHLNKKRVRKQIESDTGKIDDTFTIFIQIVSVVVPFLFSTLLYNITPNINQKIFYAFMMSIRGLSESDTAALYGVYSGKALTITTIPIAMASAMASAMIPSISARFITGEKKEANNIATKVIRVSMLVAIPSAIGLIALARPVTMILFPQRGSLDQAAMLLAVLSLTVIFYSQSTITNSVLQGTGKLIIPVINALIALIVQTVVLVLILYLTPLNNMSLVITRVIYAFILFVLNDHACRKRLRLNLNTKTIYIMPLIASVIMGVCAFVIYYVVTIPFGGMKDVGYFVNLVATGISIGVGALIYAAVLVKSGTITEQILKTLPKGNKVIRLLKKVRLL